MNLFIGCSSSNYEENIYKDCTKLLDELVKLDISLVYGDYNNGLMKLVYDKFNDNNKDIIGITTKYYNDKEDYKLTKKIISNDITNRYRLIFDNSNYLLFLPGGLGTLAELFAMIDIIEEEKINKKIILYNTNYYFTDLIEYLYKLHNLGYIEKEIYEYFIIENDIKKIIELIKN